MRTDNYDSSKKNRVPAFCDRILWKRNAKMKQLYYNSLPDVNFTDHKPVISYFQLELKSSVMRKSTTKGAFAEFLTDEFNSLALE